MFLAVRSDVLKVETLRHLKIELNGAALPASADRVINVEIDFRSVEGAVAFVHLVGGTEFI